MPNLLDASGLTVKTVTEIVTDLTVAFQTIYGPDVNVSPNSPDGQLIAILAQMLQDNLQLLAQVYNSFSLVSSYGTTLDQRASLSGIQRTQGTYTLAYVLITVTQAVTLPGQDVLVVDPGASVFTVSDTAGNKFQLKASYSFSAAGSTTLAFSSVVLGQIQTTPNTIQTISTSTVGVSTVNNPVTTNDVEGLPEQTDPQLKIAQGRSYYLQAVAPADAIRAALLQVTSCSDAFAAENDTATAALGVPANGIWIIVNGGASADIAAAIYKKKNPGCAMTGSQSYSVTRPQGNAITIYWDNATTETLYVRATLYSRIPGKQFDTVADGVALAAALTYKLGQSPNCGDIAIAMMTIEPQAIVTNAEVSSDGASWEQISSPSDYQHYFVLTAARVTLINA